MILNNYYNNKIILSAGNCKNPSETTRQLSNFIQKVKKISQFNSLLAGIIDGYGNFNLR